jgi:hypothetical protein
MSNSLRKRPLEEDDIERQKLAGHEARYAIDRYNHIEQRWEFVGFAKSESEADLYLSQSGSDEASKKFFENRKPIARIGDDGHALGEQVAAATPQDVRQQMRRSKAFEELLNVVVQRASVGTAPNILYITWEEFERMHNEYEDAKKQNMANRCDFQPLSAYVNKIIQTRDDGSVKRKLRDIYQNEVGVVTFRDGSSKVCIMKDQGPGDVGGKYHQVPTDIKE